MAEVMTAAGLALCASLQISPCGPLEIARSGNWECFGACTIAGPAPWAENDCVHIATYSGPGWRINSYVCPRPREASTSSSTITPILRVSEAR